MNGELEARPEVLAGLWAARRKAVGEEPADDNLPNGMIRRAGVKWKWTDFQ